MAEALWLVTRSAAGVPGDSGLRNDCYAVVINADDAQTAAQTIAEVVARCDVAFGAGAYPADYFDAAVIISDLTSGPLADDTDCYVFLPRLLRKIESTET